ncbi:MAG: RNA methyltransferase, partial [Cytophagales bacterium]|nr:RNA methyltransferase [Cytophagales bacterium]
MEGRKGILELLQQGVEPEHLLLTEELLATWPTDVPLPAHEPVSVADLERVSGLSSNRAGLAVLRVPAEQPFEHRGGAVLVLDGVSDPGNLGTLVRLADWFGIGQMICTADCVDFHNPKAIQASMGSFLRVRTHYWSLDVCLAWCQGLPCFVADMEGQVLGQVAFPQALLSGFRQRVKWSFLPQWQEQGAQPHHHSAL